MNGPVGPIVPPSQTQSDFANLWEAALSQYTIHTGLDLERTAFVPELLKCQLPEDVFRVLASGKETFEIFRNHGPKVRAVLAPIMNVAQTVFDTSGATALSVIPAGSLVAAAIGALLEAVNSVSKSYDMLEKLLKQLGGFLARLEIHLESGVNSAFRDIFVQTLIKLLEVLALVTKYWQEHKSSRSKTISVFFRRTKDYGQAILGNMNVQAALESLDHLTKEEHLMMAAKTLDTVQTVTLKVERIDWKVELVDTKVKTVDAKVAQVHDRQVDTDLYNWLSPPDSSRKHQDIQKRREEVTGKWFCQSNDFQEWRKQPGSVFCVYANPGAGKSVLSSSIIDYLRDDAISLDSVLLYHYFDFRDIAKQTVSGLLASLVFQMAQCSQACHALLRSFRSSSTSYVRPEDHKLLDVLQAMLCTRGTVFIVIDALDECPERERVDIFPLLKRLVHLGVDLHLVVTSRPEPDIQHQMTVLELCSHSLSLHSSHHHTNTLKSYISNQLSMYNYNDWSEGVKKKVLQILIDNSNGMFLWVQLQLQTLRRSSAADVMTVLDHLPSTLHETYERILREFSSDRAIIGRVRRVLQCVAFAVQPLSPEQVTEIYQIHFDSTSNLVIDKGSFIGDPAGFLRMKCPGLIETVDLHLESSEYLRGTKFVQFIHASAREYLLSPELAALRNPISSYRFDSSSAHVDLAKISIGALDPSNVRSLSNLEHYAKKHWFRHVLPGPIAEELDLILSRFLDPMSAAFLSWSRQQKASPLHTAAVLGLTDHAKRLIGDGIDINNTDKFGRTSLHWAILKGSEEVAQLLLEHGAALDARDISGNTPLHAAVLAPSVIMTTILLKLGANANLAGRYGLTPLYLAVQNGHDESIQLLMEYGASADARNDDGDTPLHEAIAVNSTSNASTLLNRGANVNVADCFGYTPLHRAVRNRNSDIVNLLLERGAVLDACNEDGATPLHEAISANSCQIASSLLERGANINAPGQNFSTPLHSAVMKGNIEIIQLLLGRGANVNARDEDADTPLHGAAARGSSAVSLLLECGADIDARNAYRQSPLHAAAFGLRFWGVTQADALKVVRELLSHGASVNTVNGEDQTPLYGFCEVGAAQVVRLLLERGALVSQRRKDGLTPLHAARKRKYKEGNYDEVIQLLLDHGASDEFM